MFKCDMHNTAPISLCRHTGVKKLCVLGQLYYMIKYVLKYQECILQGLVNPSCGFSLNSGCF